MIFRRIFLNRCPPDNTNRNSRARQSQGGQIVVEYVLLLAIAISIAVLLTKFLVSRSQGEEGLIIRAWQSLSTDIGADKADDVDPKSD